MTFERITTDPDVMGGLPSIRGLRIPVATVRMCERPCCRRQRQL
jgi:uncharacterized protein (DUF433 family)